MDSKEKKNIKEVALTLCSVSVLLLGSFIVDKNMYDLIYLIILQLFLFKFLHMKINKNNK